jgi:hypothetical protein
MANEIDARIARPNFGPALSNQRIMAMYISLTNGRTHGWKKWSDVHPPGNDDDDNSGGATPIALTEPPCDDREAIREPPHQPWLVPGVGTSF